MKILCVGRNYAAHIEELNNERPTEPVIFFKPDSAIIRNNEAFYYPDFSNDIHFEVEVVIKISEVAKHVSEKFAHKYYHEIGLGIDFTARDIQSKAKEKGLPWTLAKGFNGAAPISNFVDKSKFENLMDLSFSLKQNGEIKQQGNTSMMIYNIDFLIAHISKYILLKKGDLIFTGTPKGVGPIAIGDVLEGYIGNDKMLEVEIK